MQYEMLLEERGIKDDADAVADSVMCLSFHYNDSNVDAFLDMPASRLSLYIELIEEERKQMQKARERSWR